MHACERDDARLAKIEQLAREQGDWINLHAPSHLLSGQRANGRKHISVFESARQQAANARRRLQNDATKTKPPFTNDSR